MPVKRQRRLAGRGIRGIRYFHAKRKRIRLRHDTSSRDAQYGERGYGETGHEPRKNRKAQSSTRTRCHWNGHGVAGDPRVLLGTGAAQRDTSLANVTQPQPWVAFEATRQQPSDGRRRRRRERVQIESVAKDRRDDV